MKVVQETKIKWVIWVEMSCWWDRKAMITEKITTFVSRGRTTTSGSTAISQHRESEAIVGAETLKTITERLKRCEKWPGLINPDFCFYIRTEFYHQRHESMDPPFLMSTLEAGISGVWEMLSRPAICSMNMKLANLQL